MEKKITIKDIAKMSGTSKTTVSFYINGKTDKMSEETQQKIAKVIKETNYKPSMIARSLNSKNTKFIGVIIGDITNSFANQIVKGIESTASKKGYQILVGNSDYDSKKEEYYIDRMLSIGVDGFIVQPTAKFRRISKEIEKEKKPMVYFDSKLYDLKSKWVKTNNYEATYDITLESIEKGYEDYYMITADPQLISTRLERTSGFIDALDDYGKKYQELIIENNESNPEGIEEFLRERIDLNKKSLIFVPNCWALPTVFVALKEYKQYIPEKIGLVGFDNMEWVNFSSPSVTTIVQPAFEEGVEAAKIIIDEIEGKKEISGQQVLDCQINWNESFLQS